jgi:hypothetical protein
MATGLVSSCPRNNWRREGPGLSMALSPGRSGRAQDQLGHPDEKSVAAHDADGDDRPDECDDDGEYQKFRAPAGAEDGIMRRLRIMLA